MSPTVLSQLLADERDASLEAALQALERTALPHYAAAVGDENRRRLASLYDVTVRCLAERTLDAMRRHAHDVARERARDGFGLQEVHTAFNVLEEVLWRAVTTHLEPARYAEALGLVSTVLGTGKLALAVEYVALADPRSRLDTLDQSALFRGTA